MITLILVLIRKDTNSLVRCLSRIIQVLNNREPPLFPPTVIRSTQPKALDARSTDVSSLSRIPFCTIRFPAFRTPRREIVINI